MTWVDEDPENPQSNKRLKCPGTLWFAFSFFAKNEEFAAIFREKQKNILPKKSIKFAFALTNFAENFNF